MFFFEEDRDLGRVLGINVEDNGMFMPPFMPPAWQKVAPIRGEVTVGNVMAALLPHVAAAVNKAQPSAPALEWVIKGREARFEKDGYTFVVRPDPFGSGDDVAELRQRIEGDFYPFDQVIVRYRLLNGSDYHWVNPQQADFPPVEKVVQGLAMEVFKSLLK